MSDSNDFVGYNEWATRTLGVAIATDFVYETQAPDERGVFIAEDVAPHTEVFRIPLTSLLTVRSLQQVAAFQQLAFFQRSDAAREDDQLAIALLYEKHVAREASQWSKHIALLPAAYHNVLYFGSDALASMRGSNVALIAQQMEENVASDYTTLREQVLQPLFHVLLVQQQQTGGDLSQAQLDEWFSLEQYKWALSTIWSRFVSLRVGKASGSETSSSVNQQDDDDEIELLAANVDAFFGMTHVKAMVPVFDMLNHDPEAEMAHYFDMETQQFKLVSHQHWAAGAQMFINYGALSNHKLLALYGFVIDQNPFDALDLWVPMDETRASRFHEKAALLSANGFEHATTPFELTAEELNELLLITVRIQEIECDSSEQFQVLATRALDGEVLSFDNEHATLTRLIYTLQKMLEDFEDGSLENDDVLLRELDQDGGEGDEYGETEKDIARLHERMAVVVRRSDKNILLENIEMLKWKLLEILPTP